ncbi:hypothetical protein [Paenarthrobacter sp. NPDC018779]|uniref:hypothetical protein n=1 Tax=Paenarthrobacter sp. NPDC018779 TaxID=3364375 RepID=UPI0037C9DBB6
MSTPIAALLQPMKQPLEAALFHAPYRVNGGQVVQANHHPDIRPYILSSNSMPIIAEFIATAPNNQAKLIAAVEAVEQLAASWQARGEHLVKSSKLVPEDVSDALADEGWGMIYNARNVRHALTSALESAA